MFEQYYPKFEPNWPVTFTVAVKSKEQAATLACALIRVERYLRRKIKHGDFKHWNLADRLAVSRRKFQEEAGLVLAAAEIDKLARKLSENRRKAP